VPTTIIRTKPVDEKALQRRQKKGVSAVLIRHHIPSIPGVKTLNYLPNVLGKYEASKRGADEGIFTDGEDRVSEGTSSNLFIVRSGVIKTPPVQGRCCLGALPGITRGYVLELALAKGMKVMEAIITADRLEGCDEAFITNSISGIVPLIAVDCKAIGSRRPGPVTTAIQEMYSGLVLEVCKTSCKRV
jgi:branched-subunit amino acid aminotransferase/4-amino-4-deoxychorismate lyase